MEETIPDDTQQTLAAPSTSSRKPASGFLGVSWIGRNRMEVALKNINGSFYELEDGSHYGTQAECLTKASVKRPENL